MNGRLKGLNTMLVLSVLGLLLSVALVAVHLQTHLAPAHDSFCSLGTSFDCATVAASPFAVFLGLPWAIWGVLGFGTLCLAAYKSSLWLVPLSLIAALTSVALFVMSIMLVGSICFLCEGVHLLAILLAVFAFRKRHTLNGSYRKLNELLAIIAPSISLALSLMIVLPPYWASFSYKGNPPFATGLTDDGHPWIGAEKPKIELHEFVDYRCPHCRVSTAFTLRQLKNHSALRIVRRQHPGRECTVGQSTSCLFARLALCAGKQDKFWRADRYLFAHPQMSQLMNPEEMARILELDSTQLISCIESETTFEAVNQFHELTQTKKILITPSYLLNDKLLSPAEVKAVFSSLD